MYMVLSKRLALTGKDPHVDEMPVPSLLLVEIAKHWVLELHTLRAAAAVG
jgi:hypothetical protein